MQFSIIVPIYNRAGLLPALLRSIDQQTFRDFEVVLIDDGSSDDVAVAIPEDLNFQVRLIRQKNAGGGAARNNGIDHADGRYLAFLDSDDFFRADKLETVAAEIERAEPDVLFSYTTVDRGDGVKGRKPSRPPRQGERIDEYILAAREPMQTSTLVVRREVAANVRFDARLSKFQDIDFALRLFDSGASFAFVPEELSIWTDRVSTNRVGNRIDKRNAREWIERVSPILSPKAKRGFYANLMSYEVGLSNPLLPVAYVSRAWLMRDISTKRALHSLSRALIPQRFYRHLVNAALK